MANSDHWASAGFALVLSVQRNINTLLAFRLTFLDLRSDQQYESYLGHKLLIQ